MKKAKLDAPWQRAPIERYALVNASGEVKQVGRYEESAITRYARKLGVPADYIRNSITKEGWQVVPCAIWVQLLPRLTKKRKPAKKAVDRGSKKR